MFRICMAVMAGVFLLAGCANGTGTKEDLLRAGKRQLEARDPGAAVISLKNALEQDADFFDARLELGRAYGALRKHAAAEQELRKALELRPGSGPVRQELGRACLQAGKPDEALRVIAALLAERDPETLEIAGWARELKGDHEAAVRLLSEATGTGQPGRATARLLLARANLMHNEPAAARTQVLAVLAAEPRNAQALAVLAEVQQRRNEREAAVATYDAIIAESPGNGTALFRKGLLLLQLGEAGQALDTAALLVKKPGYAAQAHELRGRCLLDQGDSSGAIAAFQKAVALRPAPETHHLLALSHYAAGELEQAMNQARRALALKPELPRPRLLAALIHLKKNKTDEALKELDKVLAVENGNAAAHSLAGSVHLAAGRQDEGLAELNRALALEPGLVDARLKKAVFELSRGGKNEAEAELNAAVRSNPDQPGSRVLLASFYLQQNRPADASEAAKQGLRNSKTDAVLYNLIADAALRQGKFDESLAALDKARAADPDYAVTYFKTALLYRLNNEQDRARDLLAKFADAQPRNAEPQLAAGRLMELTDRPDLAEQYYNRALATGSARAALQLARRTAAQGRTEAALALLDESLGKQPADARLLAMKAEISRAGKRFDDALRASRELSLADADAGLRSTIETYLVQGLPEKAVELVRRELSRYPARTELRAELSRLLARTNNRVEAEQTARRMISDKPREALGYLTLATVQQAAGRDDRAIETLRKASVADAGPLALMLGGLCQTRKDHRAALAQFNKAAAFPATRLAAGLGKAAALQALGRRAEAAREYQDVLQHSPDHVPALNNLAYLLAGEPATLPAALPYAVRAAALAPEASAVQDTLGIVLLKSGKADAALTILKQASSFAPDDPSICYHLALAFRDSGDRAGAVTYLDKAIGREFPERAEASALLARLNAAP